MSESGTKAVADSQGERRFPCSSCGAEVVFAPGVSRLECPYCGSLTDIPAAATEPIQELDFRKYVGELAEREETVDRIVSHCDNCGADVQFPPNVTSHACPFCGSNVVAVGRSVKLIRPRGILPFRIDKKGALAGYRDWIKARWFAPNDLKKMATLHARLTGIYLPFWTYDANVTTDYQGMRGEYYWVSVPYTTTVNGRTVTRTRSERRTRWYPAAGRVFNKFDDILVVATKSLQRERLENLEPWDLSDLQPYQHEYLAGFQSESYSIDLADGFGRAIQLMEPTIREEVRRDIGGDEQRILQMVPHYNEITFKHILLPVWVMAYQYRAKTFQVVVNARTGEVLGERPYSWVKITLFVLAMLALVAAIVIVVMLANGR